MRTERFDTTDTTDRLINTRDFSTKTRLITLFIIGLSCLYVAGKLFITISTTERALLPLTSTLESCTLSISTVNAPDRYGIDHFSQKAELIFYLRAYKKKFALTENIGSDYSHEQYATIKRMLNNADTVTVWIKKSEMEYWEPTVFRIKADGSDVLDLDSVRFKDNAVALFLTVLGIPCMLFPIYAFYPKLFRRHR